MSDVGSAGVRRGAALDRRPVLERRLVPLLAALMGGLLLAELDQSMVAAALPVIVADLGALPGLLWVNTAYLLAGTSVLPLCGALSDRWGRRPVIITALLLIMLGSVVGALAPSMPVLIIARVVQGFGAGGMLVLVQAAVADAQPVRDRAPTMSVIGAVFAAAAVAGPLLGGWLAQGPGWRWIFWLNLPIGMVALVACRRLLPVPVRGGRRSRLTAIDLLPYDLFRVRGFALVAGGGLLLGAAMFGSVGYLPSYLQLGVGLGPLAAGTWMLAVVAGIGVSTVVSAQVVQRTGVHRPLPVIGALLSAVALAGLAVTAGRPSTIIIGSAFVLLGLGIGCAWEILVVMAQNAVPASRVGGATALNGFTREVGVLLGTAFAGGMLAAGLTSGTPATPVFAPVFAVLALLALTGAAVVSTVPRRPLSTAIPAAQQPSEQQAVLP